MDSKRCELFVEKEGVRVCLPFPNLPANSPMRRCGDPANHMIESLSGEMVWVCEKHYIRCLGASEVIGDA